MDQSLTPELCFDGTLDNETQAYLALLTAQHNHTATSIAYMLKAHAAPPPNLAVSAVEGAPPSLTNVYSDGSVRFPNTTFSVGTFGVFWPGRATSTLTGVEADFATIVDLGPAHREAGLAIAGTVHGIFHSSARTELVAAIVALLHGTPAFLKTDNYSVVSKALALNKSCSPGKRPWSLHKDGDLWETLAQVIDRRGNSAQTIEWTKGHATLESILAGSVSAKDAIFNSFADRAADMGHSTATSRCIHQLLGYYASKQQRYVLIIRAICCRIARVAQAAVDQLEASSKTCTASNSTAFVDTPALSPNPSNDFLNLCFVALPPLGVVESEVQAEAEVRIFWQHLRIVPIDATTGVGVTWLELFVLFSLRGGNATGKPPAGKEHLHMTHATRFRAFVRRSKQHFAFADEATKTLVKPHLLRHAGNRQPLAKYGMLGNFSQLPFQLQLGDRQLHAAICSYGSRVKSAERIPLRLRSATFKAPRFAPWQCLVQPAILPTAAQRLIKLDTLSKMHPDHRATTNNTTDAPREFWLQCRFCQTKSTLACRTLYQRGTCMHIVCHACGKGASAAKWLCDCGSAWIACQSCRPLGFQCRSSRRKRGGTSLAKSKARCTKFGPSILTDAGCRIMLAPGSPPSDPPSDPPRPHKVPKLGTPCNLQEISAPSTGLGASLTNSGAKRSLEDTGGDGRTPKIIKDLRASRGSGPKCITSSTTCIRGSGLCPMTGWTIADYCPACHG